MFNSQWPLYSKAVTKALVQFMNKQMFPSHTVFKILENKIVFRTFLNVPMLSDAVSLTENGRLFQRVGPDTEKLCGPKRIDHALGMSKSYIFSDSERKLYLEGGTAGCSISTRYLGALFRLHL